MKSVPPGAGLDGDTPETSVLFRELVLGWKYRGIWLLAAIFLLAPLVSLVASFFERKRPVT
jgi:hypothetical protein